jgi:simple sugar transport system ATP-binding protein
LPGAPFRLSARTLSREVRELSRRYDLQVDPSRPVWQLSVGEQQRVEILKALQRGARILILDEPTAVLTPQESGSLMRTLRQIAAEGRTVILISHKLEEVRSVADRVTVLRGGAVVASRVPIASVSTRDLARLMVGEDSRPLTSARTPREVAEGRHVTRLILEDVSAVDERGLPALRHINLRLAEGEILGIAGVAGNGQRQLAHVVTGLMRPSSGKIVLDSRKVTGLTPRELARRGVAHVPEDRLGEGLVANLPVADNAVLRSYDRAPLAWGPLLNVQRITDFTNQLLQRFHIRGARPDSTTRLLSGGQLQRLLLAREMALQPRLIVAVHPTRGLDVAATQQVQEWLLEARDKHQVSILLISEDLDEVVQLSDRIAVLYEGRIVGTLARAEADRETLGLMMAGSHVVAPVLMEST